MTQRHEPEEAKAPVSFKLMVVAVAIYLGWRLVEGIVWVWQRIF